MENAFEIKTETDCGITSIENSIVFIEDYPIKEETDKSSDSSSFLLSSVKEEMIMYQNNDENNHSFHNDE